MSEEDWNEVLEVIHHNDFRKETTARFTDDDVRRLFGFYKNLRDEVSTPGTELYELKKDYDSHPLMETRRKK